jgi:5-methylcytosine-specific restriction endonuclease McrA
MMIKHLRRLARLWASARAGEALAGPHMRLERRDRAVLAGTPLPSSWVKLYVWRRDHGLCVRCGGQENVWFDYIVPVWEGGSITEENLQLMCRGCKRREESRTGTCE